MRKRIPLAIVSLISLLFFSGLIIMLIGSKEDSATENGITIAYQYDRDEKDEMQHLDHLLIVKVSGETPIARVSLFYRTGGEESFREKEMQQIAEGHHYAALIPKQAIGTKIYYYFEAENDKGRKAILSRKTARGKELYGGMYRIGFEREVTKPLLGLHILLIISAIVLLLHSFYFALKNILTGEDFRKCYVTILAGLIVFSITTLPIGIYVAWEAFGVGWSGIPFGWDITDNKSLIIVLFFAAILLLGRKNFVAREERFLKDKTFSLLSILGIILTVILYLIPHSI